MAGTLLVLAMVVLAVRAMAPAALALAPASLVAVVFRAVVAAAVALVVASSQPKAATAKSLSPIRNKRFLNPPHLPYCVRVQSAC